MSLGPKATGNSREGGPGRRSASQETCRHDRRSERPAGVPGQGEKGLKAEFSREGAAAPASAALAEVTVAVCAACRDASGSHAHPRPGALLAARTKEVAGLEVRVRQVECLGNCRRRLSAAILRKGCWSYVFGDLSIADAPDLVTAARLYATSKDGLLPWRGRPDTLKRGLVARIPPLTESRKFHDRFDRTRPLHRGYRLPWRRKTTLIRHLLENGARQAAGHHRQRVWRRRHRWRNPEGLRGRCLPRGERRRTRQWLHLLYRG